jgi:DNA-binding CsgD family transcriptional regulator
MSRASRRSATPNACPRTTRQRSWEKRYSARLAWIDIVRPRAILFITDPEEAAIVRRESLRQDFGLTPAEAGFTREVLKADGLQAAADRLGISLTTARTHLAHVFDKTGTRRQAELVRLILQSQPTILAD